MLDEMETDMELRHGEERPCRGLDIYPNRNHTSSCFSCLELSVFSSFNLSLLIDESTELKKVPKAQKSTFIVRTK